MRSNKPLRITKLLGRTEISRLLSRARALRELDERVHELIPAPLNDHCRILSLRDDILTLAADSPVWAARLRFHTTQLVKQLSDDQTVNLRTVRVCVRPQERSAVTRSASGKSLISKKNSHTLKQGARKVTDPELKAALERLASRGQKPAKR
jgi:hypothetical protein